MKHQIPATLFLLSLSLVPACSQAWVMEDDDPDLVDTRRIGIAGYQKITDEVVTTLLDREQVRRGTKEAKLIGWMGLTNKTSDRDTGDDIQMAANNTVNTKLVQSNEYKVMGEEVLKAVMSEVGLTDVNKLVIADSRRRFIQVLEERGAVPDYLLVGDLTSASSRGSSLEQKNYQMTFKLIDMRSGITIDSVQSKEFRKMYRR